MRGKVLYLGWCMPYDSVPHAGGQCFNKYIKEMAKYAEVNVIAMALPGESQKATLEKYGVRAEYIEFSGANIIKKFFSLNSKVNPWHKYGNLVTKYKADEILRRVKRLKNTDYYPDTIVLQWTQMILLISEIKKVYPGKRIIAVEEDVTYQRLYREAVGGKGLDRLYHHLVYKNERFRELHALKQADIIYVNNYKDRGLLKKAGIDSNKILKLVPFYHKYEINRNKDIIGKDILFFGDMGRKENYSAVVWFIEKIMPRIKIPDVRFVIMGAHPDKLYSYKSDRIIVTGYVDDPAIWFSRASIFVAPLIYGAGIKIKVLEAMYSGIPVITSKVGIEGIPAKDRQDFFLYKTDQELISIIQEVYSCSSRAVEVGLNGKRIIEKFFDYDNSLNDYTNTILTLKKTSSDK